MSDELGLEEKLAKQAEQEEKRKKSVGLIDREFIAALTVADILAQARTEEWEREKLNHVINIKIAQLLEQIKAK